ncbi:site-specific recombinase XerD [Micromonospora sp. Llam0]|uniref:tyrosine-type recombinase/integrase n=1 Tax=Micromonospora sp. Llam0 TaxID=2485143 RepID=UPI000FA09999|nr:tyrosine-type recombinase/integrase [Micromonospora sp. Llam0]ROO52669.1 site-specific recombinase XerD [Micromonospora sp. Llam0]
MDAKDVGRHRRRIVVQGPLAPFADGLREDLARQGFSPDTIVDHVHRLAGLSCWLVECGLVAGELTSGVVREFQQQCRSAGVRTRVGDRALAPVLGYLRRLGVVPPPAAVMAAVTPLDVLLSEYRRYLEDERGLAAGTVRHYLRCARTFLTGLPGSLEETLPGLSAGQVIDFVRDWSTRRRSTALDMVTLPALRSLLRFLHLAGRVPLGLSGAVPAGRGRPRNLVRPRAAARAQVRTVLAGCDRGSAVGRRDYAVLLTLARLELADIDWRAGELIVRGKGGRVDVLPLPADVGAAIADYLLHARPATAARNVFITVKAPFTGLATSSVTVLVGAACARAGVPRFGPHGMRHAAACDLLAAGASMEEIGQLLRHAQQRTTAIYARLDQARLAELARPCPQGAPR